MDDKEVAELKAILEELKALAKQYDIQIATPSYEVNEVIQYLYGNDITNIVAQSNKILDESSFTAVY
jgi:pyruvate-formate lyase